MLVCGELSGGANGAPPRSTLGGGTKMVAVRCKQPIGGGRRRLLGCGAEGIATLSAGNPAGGERVRGSDVFPHPRVPRSPRAG